MTDQQALINSEDEDIVNSPLKNLDRFDTTGKRADVLQKVDARMAVSFADAQQQAEGEQASLRDAAHLIAIERVAHACRERGWV